MLSDPVITWLVSGQQATFPVLGHNQYFVAWCFSLVQFNLWILSIFVITDFLLIVCLFFLWYFQFQEKVICSYDFQQTVVYTMHHCSINISLSLSFPVTPFSNSICSISAPALATPYRLLHLHALSSNILAQVISEAFTDFFHSFVPAILSKTILQDHCGTEPSYY